MNAGRIATLAVAIDLGMLFGGVCVAAQGVDRLVAPYLRIHSSLAADKFDGVKAEAQALAAEADKLGEAGVSLGGAARELAAAADLKGARAAFGKVSEALLAYVTKTKQALGPGLNVAYCPMVKQRWVQRGDQIQNPYYGAQMLRCGEIQKR